ncbi:MAG: ORF6N domain-containing protein, partial [Sodaliphilus sp.]|nr:ORF6N domain-containing protein [Bacteroidales bacterium]MDY5868596.1 ORF6N domain-containing protein [Sodaliphilus sp.]
MADITEKTGNGELVTNRDQLVVMSNIEPLIKVVRGQQVMLDKDLAMLYGVETKRLNEQVKRNIKRFPEDFMFQLTKEECLRSQFATLNEGRGQHLKYRPNAFTEQGVAMLSSVLRSQTAIEVNIQIMRAFVSMRHFMVNNASVFSRLETMEYHQLEMQQHLQESDK